MWSSNKKLTETDDTEKLDRQIRLYKRCALGKPETKNKPKLDLEKESHSGFLNVSSPKIMKSNSNKFNRKESCKPKKPELNKTSIIEEGGTHPKDALNQDGY